MLFAGTKKTSLFVLFVGGSASSEDEQLRRRCLKSFALLTRSAKDPTGCVSLEYSKPSSRTLLLGNAVVNIGPEFLEDVEDGIFTEQHSPTAEVL